MAKKGFEVRLSNDERELMVQIGEKLGGLRKADVFRLALRSLANRIGILPEGTPDELINKILNKRR